jgi:small multidrug resistance family-3 protein
MRSLLAFAVAAVLEIAGCFAFWSWLRRGASPLVAVAGCVSLIGFAVALTRTEVAFAGRAYAAYGGIYIVSSLAWLWIVEHQRPTRTDLIGSALAVAGALVILLFAGRPRP